ncbi:MAG: sulfatase-like hydrolase/transferase [Lachnospiraceae bacterium]|nr:sulfatase-like hydrolase/transferase [Lachnospiraceae bacterium]
MSSRNLVLVHLESLNMLNYRMNAELFPFLHNLENKSVFFSNYYSSATSTLMVLSDIAYSGYVNETFRTMRWKREIPNERDSWLDDLKSKGYETVVLDYPPNGKDAISMNCNGFLGNDVNLIDCDAEDLYHDYIESVLGGDHPFVLWLCNYLSHVDFNRYASSEESGIDRWYSGYKKLDFEIEWLFGKLAEYCLLENTTVVLYGDHGDDIYSHGFHGGLTHAIEPYSQLIHTPFYICDKRLLPSVKNNILSSIDIGVIACEMLETSVDINHILHSVSRKFVFSRNMFAAQRVKPLSFEKAYSICDGQYLMMVNSRGLSMYDINMDPTCQNNLLNLLEIDDSARYLKYHFSNIYDSNSYGKLSLKKLEMLSELRNQVKCVYELGQCEERFSELKFDVVDRCGFNKITFDKRDIKYDTFVDDFTDKRIVLFGAGGYGQYFYEKWAETINIVGWLDSDDDLRQQLADTYNYRILSPNEIQNMCFDLVFIAVLDSETYQSIYNFLLDFGISKSKII